PDPVYVPLKAKALEVMLADQLSWITAWRTERFASPQYADKYYQQALNEQASALPSSAWGYDFAHTGIVALLDIIPTT
uniref:hypothetical protein n=1 Tax=Klebsiella aerogenes TaxID=548 RepID=UPI001E3343BA